MFGVLKIIKLSKIILKIVLILLVLMIFSLGILALVVDPNSYKPQIQKLVLEKTGMTLSLPGKLSWSFWPIMGMKTTDLSLSKPADSAELLNSKDSNKPLVEVEKPEFGVDLLAWSFSIKANSLTYGELVIQNFYLNARQISFSLKQSIPLHLSGSISQGAPLPLNFDFKSKLIFDSDPMGEYLLKLDLIQMQLNQAYFSGEASVESFKKPVINLDLFSPELEVSDFVNLKGQKLNLKELELKTHFDLDLQDASVDPLSTMDGVVNISVKNALLKGINVGNMLGTLRQTFAGFFHTNDQNNHSGNITDLITAISNGSASSGWLTSGLMGNSGGSSGADAQTKIGSFNFDAQIQNGVSQSANLLLNGDRFQAKGSGEINLVQQKIDYKISVYGMTNNTPDKYVVPFVIQGSFQDPKMGIDYAILNAQLRDLLQEQAQQSIVQKISQSVPDLKNQLQGLVGNLLGNN